MIKYKYKEVASVKLGDEVECLGCGEKITLTPDSFKLDCDIEYIHCPHCRTAYDVLVYLRRKIDEGVSDV